MWLRGKKAGHFLDIEVEIRYEMKDEMKDSV